MILTHFSLFSGIGGIDYAAEKAGFTTVGQCEFADFPTKVLEKHWPDVPRWRDIRDVTANSFRERTGLHTVDLISGGFPCQPFSVAGKQKGKGDDRYLWPEMLRVIRELKPCWVFCENVPGILRIAADDVCKDLEHADYDVGIFDFEAAAVGAPHRRERVFFVGNAKHNGQPAQSELRSDEASSDKWWQEEPETSGESSRADRSIDVSGIYGGKDGGQRVMADTNHERLQIPGHESGFKTIHEEYRVKLSCSNVSNSDNRRGLMRRNGEFPATNEAQRTRFDIGGRAPEYVTGEWWSTESSMGGMADGLPTRLDGFITFPPEPDIPRVATGVKNRVDRLKCLGNAVVPAQIYPILRAIANIENNK